MALCLCMCAYLHVEEFSFTESVLVNVYEDIYIAVRSE